MRAVCAWCRADLGERPGPAGAVTHGICHACAARVRATHRDVDRAAQRRAEQALAMAPQIEEALRLLVAAVEATLFAPDCYLLVSGNVYLLCARARMVLNELGRRREEETS